MFKERLSTALSIPVSLTLAVFLGTGCGSRDDEPSKAVDASDNLAPDARDFDQVDASVASSCPLEGAMICGPESAPVDAVGMNDVVYESRSSFPCFVDACMCSTAACDFMSQLLSCDAVEGGYWWGQGSEYLRVQGRRDGKCIIEIGSEVEGGVAGYRCELPLPLSPWPGLMHDRSGDPGFRMLQGIEDVCEWQGSCQVRPDAPKQCSDSDLDPPLCPYAGSLSC